MRHTQAISLLESIRTYHLKSDKHIPQNVVLQFEGRELQKQLPGIFIPEPGAEIRLMGIRVRVI